MRRRETGPAPASAAATCARVAPHSSATAAAASALLTWCSPCTASCTGTESCPACSVKRARARSSTLTSVAQISAEWCTLVRTTRAGVLAAIAATAASSAFNTATPPPESDCGSSPFVSAMACRDPNSPR
ncbi:Uncharacterised protein [Mycobacteroides abscessus subsp. abscessus]|nr:Uncharacterised protein [Mycobacteroides abscessus subsp. abscessus]